MINMTGVVTTDQPGMFDLTVLVEATRDASGKEQKFLEQLVCQKHVIYDWGLAIFFVSKAPFTVDVSQEISIEGGLDAKSKESWIALRDSDFLDCIRSAIQGEPGISSADMVLLMENSGIRVELLGCENYGPENPVEYMDQLRESLRKRG